MDQAAGAEPFCAAGAAAGAAGAALASVAGAVAEAVRSWCSLFRFSSSRTFSMI